MKVDKGHGTPTYVARRNDNGVTLHQGASRIRLAPDELAAVLDAIRSITGQRSPHGAEKTKEIGNT